MAVKMLKEDYAADIRKLSPEELCDSFNSYDFDLYSEEDVFLPYDAEMTYDKSKKEIVLTGNLLEGFYYAQIRVPFKKFWEFFTVE